MELCYHWKDDNHASHKCDAGSESCSKSKNIEGDFTNNVHSPFIIAK